MAARAAGPTAGLTAGPMAARTAGPMAARTAGPTVARTAGPKVRPTAARPAYRVSATAVLMVGPTVGRRCRRWRRQRSRVLTATTQEPSGRLSGIVSGQPPAALSRLVAVGQEDFAGRYWGRRALLSRAEDLASPGFADLLDAASIDELVSERGLRTPFLRVAKAGSTLAEKTFTAPGGVGATIADQVSDDRLTRLFADGSTLVLQALHRSWPPVLSFCQDLAAELGHPVQANAYVTPPQNQGFSDHYDVHDVFVLQIEGEKRWLIHEPVLESPSAISPGTTAGQRSNAEPPSRL